MPCTAGGAPVTIDRLFGLVNDGTTQSAVRHVPVSRNPAMNGTRPLAIAWLMYSGSQPSTQTTTSGRDGLRYVRPLTVIDAGINGISSKWGCGLVCRGGRRKRGAMHPLAARHDVIVERAPGRGRLARGDALDDGAMLARGDGQHAALGERCVTEEVQLVDEPAIHDEELRVARELDQPVVKLDVGREIGVDVATAGGALHPVDAIGELPHLLGGRRLREAPADEFVEHGAQLVDLVRFLDRNPAHEHAAVLLELDQSRFLQRAERLAHRAARHAEPQGDRRFVQLAAGGELAREDHALELLLHERRQRARLDERDGVGAAARGRRPSGPDFRRDDGGRAGGRAPPLPSAWVVFSILRIGPALV